MRMVKSALERWTLVCARHNWSRVIVSDDPSRGGKLATFIVYLLDDTELTAGTITNYLWGVRTWMKLQRQLDPAYGIVEWDDMLRTVAVIAFVPSEPRKAVPIEWLYSCAAKLDKRSFKEVQNFVLQLILLFTFARSETPLPTSFTGIDGPNPMKHITVADVEVRPAAGELGAHLAVKLKGTKADQRAERPEAAGNEDWILIGDMPGHALSILMWVQLLFSLHGRARDPSGMFFVHHGDHTLPYRYGTALSDSREMWAKYATSRELAVTRGLHGLRVSGYDRGRRGPSGVELAVAQGAWRSSAHLRYERFSMSEVLALPSSIVELGEDAVVPEPPTGTTATRDAVTLPTPVDGELVAHSCAPIAERSLHQQSPSLRRGRSRARTHDASPRQPTPANVPSPRPLGRGKAAVGRIVMVPHTEWPTYHCDENGGQGWTAQILSCSRGAAMVKFVYARDVHGHSYPNESLSLHVLRPL